MFFYYSSLNISISIPEFVEFTYFEKKENKGKLYTLYISCLYQNLVRIFLTILGPTRSDAVS